MMHTFIIAACVGLAAAHGQIKEFTVDGNKYPAFDPQLDYDPKWNAKRIEYGFAKGKSGNGPVEDVRGKDITCRYAPLKMPEIEAEVRAGANVSFKWLDWFTSHKGPVITFMGEVPASGDPADTDFFKIDEATYDPKTMTWGSDWLIQNNGVHEVTIPSDIKPGSYIIRHEIISLHNALNDDYIKKSSGAQFYPQCIKVKVTGDGTARPPGVKFPGGYTWDEKGILVNIFYRANEYTSPGPPLYKPTIVAPPKGPQPPSTDVKPSEAYVRAKNRSDETWQNGVHSNDAKHPGGGGCIWEVGADPKTAKCSPLNTANPEYQGMAQPPQSPGYVDQAHTDRSFVKYGPVIKYLFDPTQPRMEERVKSGMVQGPAPGSAVAAAAPKSQGGMRRREVFAA